MRWISHIAACIAICFCSATYAQNKANDKEETLKAQKIAFITEKLGLTPDEAKLFWPIYDQYWEKKNKIIEERRASMKYFSDNTNRITEAEASEYSDRYAGFARQEAELLQEYNQKFKSILPPTKVMKLYLADYDFKNYLLQKIKASGNAEQTKQE